MNELRTELAAGHPGRKCKVAFLMILTGSVVNPALVAADTRINVGDDFQTVINDHPTERRFIVASGTHRPVNDITPANDTSFIGENGAIIKGSKLLNPASAAQSGDLYYWEEQTQEKSGGTYNVGVKAAEYARECFYANELFVNGQRWRHVNTKDDVNATGKWFFDYAANRIYMYGSPAGLTIETSVRDRAFNLNNKTDIRLENLTISQYANITRPHGPVELSGSNRIVFRNNEFSYNHAAGTQFGPNMIVENCRFIYNGQIGAVGGAKESGTNIKRPIYIRNNEFAYNAQLGFSAGEEGAFKVAESNGAIAENNWVHHNPFYGLWFDVYNEASIIRSNLVEGSPQWRGIYYEIGGNDNMPPTEIFWNIVRDQYDPAICVRDSSHVYVYENAVTTNHYPALSAEEHNEKSSDTNPAARMSRYRAWGNDVRILNATPTSKSHIVTSPNIGPSAVEYINYNTYRGSDYFKYFGTDVNFATWQSHGYDTNSTFTTDTTGEAQLPSWAKAFQPSQYGPLPATRVGHWRLDESSGTTATDYSGNGYNGTVTGNPTWQPTGGQRDGAIDFEQDDGTQDYVNCGTTPGSALALTVAFWMKPESIRNMIPVGKSSGDSTGSNMSKGWAFKVRSDGDIKFRVGGEYSNTDISAGPGTYTTNWTHVAATFSNGTAKLYINGVLKATGTGITTRSVDNTSTALRLGVNAAGNIEPYDGLLDDVQIYSQALNAGQIQGIMGSTSPLRPKGSWRLNEVEGTTTADDSGNGNLGTLVNNPPRVGAKQGYGLNLNGNNQRVTVLDSSNLDVAGNKITLMAWIKADAVNDYRAIISKLNSTYELSLHDGKPRLELKLSDGSSMRAETTNVEISTGAYYHVVTVRDGATILFYVNGVSKPVTYIDTAKTLNLATNSSELGIGFRPVGTMSFDGIIDEAEVYDTALSSGEVLYAKDN